MATNDKDQKDQIEEVLTRDRSSFSKKFQTILYSHPKHTAVVGFYLIIITALVLGTWAYFSKINKSYLSNGEVSALSPDISVSLNAPFEFRRHLTHIGQIIKKDDALFEYYNDKKQLQTFNSTSSGKISSKANLKQSMPYPAGTELLTIRQEDQQQAVKLYIPESLLNKVKINNPVIFHFNFSIENAKKPITGFILTEPLQVGDQYVAEAKIDDDRLEVLSSNGIKLMNGMTVSAEIVIGKERLLERFLGVKL